MVAKCSPTFLYNSEPRTVFPVAYTLYRRRLETGKFKTDSIRLHQFMLQPSRNKWRAIRQQEVWQITAPKAQFAMETARLSIQNCVRCSGLTLSWLPLSPSRPGLPVKGQGGRSSPPAAILRTSANLALTSLVIIPRERKTRYPDPLPVLEWHRKVQLEV